MDTKASHSHSIPDKVKKEAARLKASLLKRGDLSQEDVRQMLEWLNTLQESPFGCYLLLNKSLNGSWPFYRQEATNLLDKRMFVEIQALKAMQQRFETQQTALARFVFSGMALGVYPASYAGEWSFLEYEAEASVVGVHGTAGLVASEAHFDAVIRNVFLYGDEAHDDDPYTYLFSSLKPGGVLLTSTWVAPEDPQDVSLRQESLLFEELLGMSRCEFHAVSKIKARLRHAGFEHVQLLNDENGRLRSIIAKKPLFASNPLKTKRAVAHTPRRMTRKGVCFRIFTLAPA